MGTLTQRYNLLYYYFEQFSAITYAYIIVVYMLIAKYPQTLKN